MVACGLTTTCDLLPFVSNDLLILKCPLAFLPFIATSLGLCTNFAALLQSTPVAALDLEGTETKCRLGFFQRNNWPTAPTLISDCWPGWQFKQLVLLSLSTAQSSQPHLPHKQIGLASLQIDSIQFWRFTYVLHHPSQRQHSVLLA